MLFSNIMVNAEKFLRLFFSPFLGKVGATFYPKCGRQLLGIVFDLMVKM